MNRLQSLFGRVHNKEGEAELDYFNKMPPCLKASELAINKIYSMVRYLSKERVGSKKDCIYLTTSTMSLSKRRVGLV
jgi:hypothetical protein